MPGELLPIIDPDIVRALRARGIPCIFGNAAHLSMLERTHVDRASLVVITILEKAPASVVVRNVRKLNRAVPIMARAHRVADREDLLKNGATHVIEPETEASATLVSNALRYLHLPEPSAEGYVATLRASLDNDVGAHKSPEVFPLYRKSRWAVSTRMARRSPKPVCVNDSV